MAFAHSWNQKASGAACPGLGLPHADQYVSGLHLGLLASRGVGTREEWQLLLKTRADHYDRLEAHLLERHPWDNPEIVAVSIVAGSADYLRWLDNSLSSGAAG